MHGGLITESLPKGMFQIPLYYRIIFCLILGYVMFPKGFDSTYSYFICIRPRK
nr:Translation initiation factor IF-1 [Ammopiptanthus mongolicus]